MRPATEAPRPKHPSETNPRPNLRRRCTAPWPVWRPCLKKYAMANASEVYQGSRLIHVLGRNCTSRPQSQSTQRLSSSPAGTSLSDSATKLYEVSRALSLIRTRASTCRYEPAGNEPGGTNGRMGTMDTNNVGGREWARVGAGEIARRRWNEVRGSEEGIYFWMWRHLQASCPL